MRVLCQRSFFILELQHPHYYLWLTPHQHKPYCSIARPCKKSSLRSWRKWQVSSGVMPSVSRMHLLLIKQCCAMRRKRSAQISTWVRLRDLRSRSLGTTCLTITSVFVVLNRVRSHAICCSVDMSHHYLFTRCCAPI